MNFLGGERRGHLRKASDFFFGKFFERDGSQRYGRVGSLRFAVRIVGVRSETEAKAGRITLAAAIIKLH